MFALDNKSLTMSDGPNNTDTKISPTVLAFNFLRTMFAECLVKPLSIIQFLAASKIRLPGFGKTLK